MGGCYVPCSFNAFWYPHLSSSDLLPVMDFLLQKKWLLQLLPATLGYLGINSLFPYGCCHLIVQPCTMLPLVPVGGGKVLTISAVFKLFFVCLCLNDILKIHLRKFELLQFFLSSLNISTVSTLQVFVQSVRDWRGFPAPLFPQYIQRSICLLPDTQLGETAPRYLSLWCWISPLPQKCFCLCMGV